MFCPNCGTQNPDEARYCGNCSKQLPVSAQAAGGNPPGFAAAAAPTMMAPGWANPANAGWMPAATMPAPKASVSSSLNIGVIIASIIIPFVGMVMGAIYAVDSDPAKKDAGRRWLVVGIVAFVVYLLIAMSGG